MQTFRRLGQVSNQLLRLLTGLALVAQFGATACAQELRIGGTGAALGTMQRLSQAYKSVRPSVTVVVMPSMGSGAGIRAVLAGDVQLAVSSRPPSSDELRSGAVASEYGRTPFVFAVSAASKVNTVTTQDLVDLYGGKRNTWPDGTPVRLVLRPAGDADSVLIQALSSTLREAYAVASNFPAATIAISDQAAAQEIEQLPGAIGPSTLALITAERRGLKALTLNGVAPTVANLSNRSYPLFRPMYLVTGADPSGEVQRFVAFVRSDAARTILEQTGHWVK